MYPNKLMLVASVLLVLCPSGSLHAKLTSSVYMKIVDNFILENILPVPHYYFDVYNSRYIHNKAPMSVLSRQHDNFNFNPNFLCDLCKTWSNSLHEKWRPVFKLFIKNKITSIAFLNRVQVVTLERSKSKSNKMWSIHLV